MSPNRIFQVKICENLPPEKKHCKLLAPPVLILVKSVFWVFLKRDFFGFLVLNLSNFERFWGEIPKF
jgi:hypothetical protein